jgi:putative Ca2+/H+ antiporter (TMEM165/GDT1 family)
VHAFLLSLGVIFVAELGDKSQLMALAFSTRFSPWRVLVGITIATAVTHAVSVGIGDLVGNSISGRWVNLASGLAFVGFAAWTLRGDSLDEDEQLAADRARRKGALATITAVGVTFFLAELGDKTMLATITLATREGALGTWAGSTVGMVAADALAIVIGRLLGSRLPDKAIRYGAAAAFLVFGALLLIDAAKG